MSNAKRLYHGWIVVEDGGVGYKEFVSVEWQGEDGVRYRLSGDESHEWRGESGCTQAVEWWDAKLQTNVKLEPAMKGCYRVYTEAMSNAESDS
jgi:hypothetical protein